MIAPPKAWMGGFRVRWKPQLSSGVGGTDFGLHFQVFGMSSFGNFVFFGLRSNSGTRHQSNVDLYLQARMLFIV